MDGEEQSAAAVKAPSELPKDLREPPEHLTETAKEFFRHIVNTVDCDAAARVTLIRWCEVRDQLEALRQDLSKLPGGRFIFIDKHSQPRLHPLAKHDLALTNEFGKLFRLLGFDQAPTGEQSQRFFNF